MIETAFTPELLTELKIAFAKTSALWAKRLVYKNPPEPANSYVTFHVGHGPEGEVNVSLFDFLLTTAPRLIARMEELEKLNAAIKNGWCLNCGGKETFLEKVMVPICAKCYTQVATMQ